MSIDLTSFAQYESLIRYQVAGLFAEGWPMWIVPNTNQAERAVLAINAEQGLAIPYPANYPYRKMDLSFTELSPKAA